MCANYKISVVTAHVVDVVGDGINLRQLVVDMIQRRSFI